MTERVVKAARETPTVHHFVLVTALGTVKFGLPASILNLFWGILTWKGKAERALRESGIAYTILRPGGMELPTDDYEKTHNVRIGAPDTLFGGLVSRLQVAKLAAAAVVSPESSTNKVLEIVAATDVPKVSYADLVQNAEEVKGEDKVWRKRLNPLQFYILKMGGTEGAYTSALNSEKRKGVFTCAGCGEPLFRSETKYNSRTGWPSFYDAYSEDSLTEIMEGGVMPRKEVRCANCDGHLGHVFPDGPPPTGLRYCINGGALEFEPEDE
ncbi:unnamed protein product [Discosporangium mesarthrocarpum]